MEIQEEKHRVFQTSSPPFQRHQHSIRLLLIGALKTSFGGVKLQKCRHFAENALQGGPRRVCAIFNTGAITTPGVIAPEIVDNAKLIKTQC